MEAGDEHVDAGALLGAGCPDDDGEPSLSLCCGCLHVKPQDVDGWGSNPDCCGVEGGEDGVGVEYSRPPLSVPGL